MRPQLRLYDGQAAPAPPPPPPKVPIRLAELTQVLREAVASERAWIEDFGEDEVQISEDLYDVLSAVRAMRVGA